MGFEAGPFNIFCQPKNRLKLSSTQALVDFAEQRYAMGYRAFKMHRWCEGNVKKVVQCAAPSRR